MLGSAIDDLEEETSPREHKEKVGNLASSSTGRIGMRSKSRTPGCLPWCIGKFFTNVATMCMQRELRISGLDLEVEQKPAQKKPKTPQIAQEIAETPETHSWIQSGEDHKDITSPREHKEKVGKDHLAPSSNGRIGMRSKSRIPGCLPWCIGKFFTNVAIMCMQREVRISGLDVEVEQKPAQKKPKKRQIAHDELPIVDPVALQQMMARFPKQDQAQVARFLKGDDENVEVATERLERHIAWADSHLPVNSQEIAELLETHSWVQSGEDHCGHPVVSFMGIRHVPSDVAKIKLLFAYHMEACIASMPEGVHRVLVLISAPKGTPFDTDLVRAVSQVLVDHYPLRVWKVLVFPTGLVTGWVWGICKYFVDPVTRDMIRLMPSGGGRQPPELLEYIDKDELLEAFGGNRPEGGGRNYEIEVLKLREAENN